jgi:hypothetical protein
LIAVIFTLATLVPVASFIEAERTGVALYAPNPKLPAAERVTRTGEPGKFRDAITLSVYHALYSGAIALVSFCFFRRLSN